jgi:hypothetical protein
MIFISKYLDDNILTIDNVNNIHELKIKLLISLKKINNSEFLGGTQEKKYNYNDIFIFNKDTNEHYENNKIITDTLNNFYYKILFNKCNICMKQAVKITGDCSYCKYKFCNIHRLPEYHNCISMKDCRIKSYEENYQKVISQKCVATQL